MAKKCTCKCSHCVAMGNIKRSVANTPKKQVKEKTNGTGN
jgi:hypothetical protein